MLHRRSQQCFIKIPRLFRIVDTVHKNQPLNKIKFRKFISPEDLLRDHYLKGSDHKIHNLQDFFDNFLTSFLNFFVKSFLLARYYQVFAADKFD